MNLPNKLSLTRIILIPFVIAFFYLEFIPANFLIAAIIYVIASITDFLDGYIARKYHMVTDFGKFIDPIADKILVLASLVILLTKPMIFAGNIGENFGRIIGGVGVSIIVAREMMVSVLRMIAASKGQVLAAEKIGKIKTFTTDICIPILMVVPLTTFNQTLFNITFYVGIILFIVSVLLTIYSGIFYLVKNKKIFSETK